MSSLAGHPVASSNGAPPSMVAITAGLEAHRDALQASIDEDTARFEVEIAERAAKLRQIKAALADLSGEPPVVVRNQKGKTARAVMAHLASNGTVPMGVLAEAVVDAGAALTVESAKSCVHRLAKEGQIQRITITPNRVSYRLPKGG